MSIKKLYRKVTFRFLRISSLLISAILGIICGSGCVKTEDLSAAYGPRSANYKVSGTVVSSDQNLPIKGLAITIQDAMYHYSPLYSTKTDSLGRYSLEFYGNGNWRLNVTDVDTTENGAFIAKDTIISIPLVEDTSYFEKKVDIKLDRMK